MGRGMADRPPCTHSPRTVLVKVGRPEASLGEAGLEQLQDLARGKSLPPGGRFEEEEVTRKAPASSAVADIRASGQRVGLGGFCPQRCKRTPALSRALCHFFRTLEKWEQRVVPWSGEGI